MEILQLQDTTATSPPNQANAKGLTHLLWKPCPKPAPISKSAHTQLLWTKRPVSSINHKVNTGMDKIRIFFQPHKLIITSLWSYISALEIQQPSSQKMVLFIRDENRMKDLWKAGIVTKVIRSKTDDIPRTIELRTATSKKIVRPIQKLAIPEWEITQENDHPISQFLSLGLHQPHSSC